MRSLICLCVLVALTGCKEDVYFIPGTGTLPDCNELPDANLDGTVWFDQGTVTIQTMGCLDTTMGDKLEVCPLDWVFTQNENDVTIIVDEEYRLEGRLCGDQLHLRGGWWLPVRDEDGNCYEDDSAEEVGIMSAGNVLTLSSAEQTMTGILAVSNQQGNCAGEYEVTFMPVP